MRDTELTTLEQHLLLAIIGLHPNAYGVSIQDQIKARTGREPSTGSVYASLDRLEEKGFVKSRQGEATPERGGKRKLYFTNAVSSYSTNSYRRPQLRQLVQKRTIGLFVPRDHRPAAATPRLLAVAFGIDLLAALRALCLR